MHIECVEIHDISYARRCIFILLDCQAAVVFRAFFRLTECLVCGNYPSRMETTGVRAIRVVLLVVAYLSNKREVRVADLCSCGVGPDAKHRIRVLHCGGSLQNSCPILPHAKILFIFSLPIDTRSIFTDRGHELVFDLVTITSSDIYNSFVKCTRAKDIDVLASAFAASQIQCIRLME